MVNSAIITPNTSLEAKMCKKRIFGEIPSSKKALSYLLDNLKVCDYGVMKPLLMNAVNSTFYNLFNYLFDPSRRSKYNKTVKHMRSVVFYLEKMLFSLEKEHIHFELSMEESYFSHFISDDISNFLLYTRSIFDQVGAMIENEEMIDWESNEKMQAPIAWIFNGRIKIIEKSGLLKKLKRKNKKWFKMLSEVRNKLVHRSLEVGVGPSEKNEFIFRHLDETKDMKTDYHRFDFYTYAVNLVANIILFLDEVAAIIIAKYSFIGISEEPYPSSAFEVIGEHLMNIRD
ncbi:hypothetical protein KAI78_08265 [bacterium]|nr:hypothetical protein [bacterium]